MVGVSNQMKIRLTLPQLELELGLSLAIHFLIIKLILFELEIVCWAESGSYNACYHEL